MPRTFPCRKSTHANPFPIRAERTGCKPVSRASGLPCDTGFQPVPRTFPCRKSTHANPFPTRVERTGCKPVSRASGLPCDTGFQPVPRTFPCRESTNSDPLPIIAERTGCKPVSRTSGLPVTRFSTRAEGCFHVGNRPMPIPFRSEPNARVSNPCNEQADFPLTRVFNPCQGNFVSMSRVDQLRSLADHSRTHGLQTGYKPVSRAKPLGQLNRETPVVAATHCAASR